MQIEITDNSGLVKEELQAAALRTLEMVHKGCQGCDRTVKWIAAEVYL